MGDMTIVYSQQCKSLSQTHFMTEDGRYTIFRSSAYEWVCSCPAWKYNATRPCKHIKALKVCGWHREYDGDPPQNQHQRLNYICPRCGGETETIKIAI